MTDTLQSGAESARDLDKLPKHGAYDGSPLVALDDVRVALAGRATAPQTPGVVTDAQISAGAEVLCDCPKPKRIGRSAAISVFDAMSAAPEKRGCTSCDWEGETDRMCGSVGPLCPSCGDTTEALAAQPVEAAGSAVQAGPYGYHYEWASCMTADGPQRFKWEFDRESPPDWAIESGQARNVTPLYTATHPAEPVDAPIRMILHCPNCHVQHIDAPDERTASWTNPPHRSHLCHACGHIWRPADVATEGVRAIQTKGSKDSVVPAVGSALVAKTEQERAVRIFKAGKAVGIAESAAAPAELPTNDEVHAEVLRARGHKMPYVSSNAVNDVMAAVRALLATQPTGNAEQGERDA